MAPLKQKRWNFFAAVALLLALVLGVTGISQLNFSTEPRTDSLQLSSAEVSALSPRFFVWEPNATISA